VWWRITSSRRNLSTFAIFRAGEFGVFESVAGNIPAIRYLVVESSDKPHIIEEGFLG
jgi:hypothetical protein